MRKILNILVLLVFTVMMLVGCSNSSDVSDVGQTAVNSKDTEESKALPKVDTLYCAIRDDIESLSPVEICTSNSGDANRLIYETLFSREPDGTVVPKLVESYERVDDTTYKFKLKEGIMFHDGTEMTAEDVKASLDWAGTWPVPQVHKKTVEVTDKYIFTITTPLPDSLLIEDDLSVGWNAILPKALIESENDFKVNPIGSGPYKFVERSTAEYLKFEKFEDYREDPDIDNSVKYIVLKVIPDGSSRTMALESGDINLNSYVEVMDIDRLVENSDIEVIESPNSSIYNLTLNSSAEPFDDINVRKAVAYAIDPEAAMIAQLNGSGSVMRTIVKPGTIGYSDENAPEYDPEKAKQLLKEAGYEPNEIEINIMIYSSSYAACAESIQADLAEVGIKAKIESVEIAVMIDRTASGDFDSLIVCNSGLHLNYNMVGNLFASRGLKGPNRCFMSNPEYDKLVDSIPTIVDEKELEEVYSQCINIVQGYYGIVPMFIGSNYTAYSKDITNVKRSVLGSTYFERVQSVN